MAPALNIQPAAMADAARSFRGAPYRFKSCTDAFDGFGLIRACVAKATGADLDSVPDVARETPDWTEAVTLFSCAQWLRDMGLERVVDDHARPGDVLVFQMAPGKPGVHVAVLTETRGEEPKMVHAYWGRAVIESWMGSWSEKMVSAYRLTAAPAAMREAA